MNEERRFNWGYLIIGILLVSFMSLVNPESNLLAIVMYFGVGAIIKGCFELFNRRKINMVTGEQSNLPILIGILDIIIGVLLLFNIGASLAMLPYFFAAWFLIDSINDLFFAKVFKGVSNEMYWFTIIANVLGIILAVMLLFDPITSALTLSLLIGAYFMITGVTYIVAAFR